MPRKTQVASPGGLTSALNLLNVRLARAKTKSEARNILRAWSTEYLLFEYFKSEKFLKKDLDYIMENAFKQFVLCCLEHRQCWNQLPSYSTFVKSWMKQIKKYSKEEKGAVSFHY
jgi:hypothetical protein